MSPKSIRKVYCEVNCLDDSIIDSNSRKTVMVIIRYVYIFLLRKYSGLSVTKLSLEMNRDHTTISYALDKIGFLNGKDSQITKLITNFEKTIFQNETESTITA